LEYSKSRATNKPNVRFVPRFPDAQGRTAEQQIGNLTPSEFSYDANGRLDGIAQGSRATTMTYDSTGNIDSVTELRFRRSRGQAGLGEHDLL